MKLFKIAALALVALGSAEVASAQTKIYITGSSAYREYVHRAIMKLLGSTDNGVTLPSGSSFGYTSNATVGVSGSNAAIFKGSYNTGNGTAEVIIKTSWSGSGAGVQTVASSNSSFTVGFIPDATATTSNGSASITDPRPTNSVSRDAQVPQIAFSDVYQGSTPFSGAGYDSLTDTIVGVIGFQWVLSDVAAGNSTTLNATVKSAVASNFNNMTPLLARATWIGTGSCPLALYLGNSTFQSTRVYATGRDPDSGTRITALAESGIGISTGIRQFNPSTNALYTAQTVNGIVFPTGRGGESSGGTLASKMGADGLSRIYVSYMGISDATTLVGLGGKALKWNGFDFSLEAIEQGQYTFWGYQHLMYKSSLSGIPKTFADALATQISTVDGVPLLSDMNVVRSGDGGVVTANY